VISWASRPGVRPCSFAMSAGSRCPAGQDLAVPPNMRDPSSPRLAPIARRDPRRCVARGHRMGVPAAGRCLCGGRRPGGVPPSGLPVVRRAAGVLVWLPAVCPGGGPLHGLRVAERTVRAQLRRAGLHREALAAEPRAFGRYEAGRPNERWITDVLIGPWVPYPKREGSARARRVREHHATGWRISIRARARRLGGGLLRARRGGRIPVGRGMATGADGQHDLRAARCGARIPQLQPDTWSCTRRPPGCRRSKS
jgi:hypothetical protein